MIFDFRQIVGPEDSKQDNFSSLCNLLLLRLFPDAKPVDGRGGDEGIDTFVGEFNGICKIFQHKYFVDRIGRSQRQQIERSIDTALSKHQVEEWILMVPIDLNPAEIRWFQTLKSKYRDISIDWWGKSRLRELLAAYLDIAQGYQPLPMVVLMKESDINISDDSPEQIANVIQAAIKSATIPQTISSAQEMSSSSVINGIEAAIAATSSVEEQQDVFLAAAEDIKKQTALKILVWGPGSTGELYSKRLEIRTQLERLGHEAYFSEDVWKPDILRKSGLNLSVAEFIQAKAYDYIICLMDSPGAIGEVHDFARTESLAHKMMVCVDISNKEGYSAHGILNIFEGCNGKIDWFERPVDIADCHLMTRILSQLQKVREAKQWLLLTGGNIA